MSSLQKQAPALPLQDFLFPTGSSFTIEFASASAKALFEEEILNKKEKFLIIIGKNLDENLLPIGTLVEIIHLNTIPDSYAAEVRTLYRVKISNFLQKEPYLKVKYREFPLKIEDSRKAQLLYQELRGKFALYMETEQEIPLQLRREILFRAKNLEELIFDIISVLHLDGKTLNDLFSENALEGIAKKLSSLVEQQIVANKIKNEINRKVRQDLDKRQRDYILREQLKTIQSELGEEDEISSLKKRFQEKNLPEEVRKVFERELRHLERTPPFSPEYGVTLNYLEWILELPWNEYSEEVIDIVTTKKILDEDHYGLEKVKDRILDYLAVLQHNPEVKAPILCFVGPPGVGKTSLGKSIARALQRKFVRISLGGVRDESEIRGHRKTYIGAMPGKIIQGMRKAKTSNPVFLLDEVDKMGADFRGDPASALLEVLDPEQNNTFNDHFLGTDYDLSKVLFIATANSLETIHPALLDRMEIIRISGYTPEEKIEIAKRHLIPGLRKELKLKAKQFAVSQGALLRIIENYTLEAGVRQLKQVLDKLARKTVRKILEENIRTHTVSLKALEKLLGPPKYLKEEYKRIKTPGVALGLAWTPYGGDILFIEVVTSPGKGRLSLTGRLGEIMKESAQVAYAYLKANAKKWKIKTNFDEIDVFIHIPAGATPKDGPSAGITLLSALLSAFTHKTLRPDIAMTGEITLRGNVLPVGGIKEKLLAARRAKVKKVLMPELNRKDLRELPETLIENLEIVFVSTFDDVEKEVLP